MNLPPEQAMPILQRALGIPTPDSGKEDPRTRQAQLSFSAMLSAVQSGCQCEACQLLREAVDTMRVRPKSLETSHGPGDNPQT